MIVHLHDTYLARGQDRFLSMLIVFDLPDLLEILHAADPTSGGVCMLPRGFSINNTTLPAVHYQKQTEIASDMANTNTKQSTG